MALPEPPRSSSYGFLYFPPHRVQGYSIAGEETFVQIPELDVCFDMGRAPRLMLTSNFVALTHGHMDHSAGISYYFSQRVFQGMGTGTLICPEALAGPVRRMMEAWVPIETQRTPHKIIGLAPDGEIEIKKHQFLRAFDVNHTVPSLGFVVVEKRSKLKDQYAGLPQEKLVELKKAGQEITYIKEVPLVAYIGDTAPGDFFSRPDVANARILVTECTFVEPGHQDKARVGKHLHVDDIAHMLRNTAIEHIVLTHLSRRSHLGQVKQELESVIPREHRHRLHILMDHRANRARYDRQLAEDAASEAARPVSGRGSTGPA